MELYSFFYRSTVVKITVIRTTYAVMDAGAHSMSPLLLYLFYYTLFFRYTSKPCCPSHFIFPSRA